MRDVDPEGHPDLPHQSWVSATLDTPVGELTGVCVCIPWWDSQVKRFGGTKERWQEHMEYLALLPAIITGLRERGPVVVAGDYNQFVPAAWAPRKAADALAAALTGMAIATTGVVDPGGRGLIDHLAHTPDLAATGHRTWGGRDHEDRPMSDHSGVVVELQRS